MIKIENAKIVGWEEAIRGMRNPMNSWSKSDSYRYSGKGPSLEEAGLIDPLTGCHTGFEVGDNDLSLMKKLRDAGTDHRKFMRMITVYMDIKAPLYWWKEYDTYKVGTVANSCSTMHKIAAKEFTLDDFSHEHLSYRSIRLLGDIIGTLNDYRYIYLDHTAGDSYVEEDGRVIKKKDAWHQMIQLLPSSYNQLRTVMLNYEVLANMYKSRKNHKLDEWRTFCEYIKTFPYSELITGKEED